ncbi:dTDP-glucose 4,6-dehydratase [bacterium BMS3Abin02]|nr:dTDP-glucose 4,6-dehydratase [bacterium BMS3Abin02]GBE20829.1 dTDP-glucose 4,6-dehydratase [bacterium BMS3Bbin01]HDK46257.1 NAD-dependent epimerase/dehydratase family protein [Actinomycetota bacterium]HDL49804.1 NAD-dependent epimerase/dehydratase family protein [Actinomycetota bacterium]
MDSDQRFAGCHAVVLGGAGFLGSHLCDRLIEEGARVTVVDNLITGREANVGHLFGRSGFVFLYYDITNFLHVPGDVDFVIHFASPASPADYLRWPIQTLKVGSLGTHKALGLARAKQARFLLASTSEVYGDPAVSPQPESYWGNVNPVGPRGVYDEAKRFAEAMTLAYHRQHAVDVRIARIFNTYGPRMRLDDGRAVPAFFAAALRDQKLPVHGDGMQTRSLCYVDDLIEGIMRLLLADVVGPVNLGMPEEVTILGLAEMIQTVVGRHPGIVLEPRPEDDPGVRCPQIDLATRELGWTPTVTLHEGLERTLPWFRAALQD